MRRTLTATAILSAAILAPATNADIIHYDNADGTLVFNPIVDGLFPPDTGIPTIDITQNPNQTEAYGANTIVFEFYPEAATPNWNISQLVAFGDARLAVSDPVIINDETGFPTPFTFLNLTTQGTTIGPATQFASQGTAALSNFYTDPWILLPAPDGFLGVSIKINGQTHYGWIEFSGSFDPVAWAWQTLPNTPIAAGAIPAPGPLALLAATTLLTTRRRRKLHPTMEQTPRQPMQH